MEQSNSLDITTKMLAAEAAATLTTELSQCSGHFTLDWAKFVVARQT